MVNPGLLGILSSTTIFGSAKLQEMYSDLTEKEEILREKLKIQTRQFRSTFSPIIISLKKRIKSKNRHQLQSNMNIKESNTCRTGYDTKRIKIYDIFEKIDSDYVNLRRGKPITFDNIYNIL